jgi:hypothetical protein
MVVDLSSRYLWRGGTEKPGRTLQERRVKWQEAQQSSSTQNHRDVPKVQSDSRVQLRSIHNKDETVVAFGCETLVAHKA